MKKIHAFACALAFAAALPPSPVSAEEAGGKVPFLGGFLRETRIVYPLAVGDWTARDEHRYEPQEAGVSVRYARDSGPGWIDLYFYPAGVLSDAQVENLVAQEVDALRQTWLKAPGSERDMSALRTFDIPLEGGDQPPAKARAVDFVYEHEDRRRNSAMVVLLDRMYVVKGRYSVPEDALARDEVSAQLQGFVTEVVPKLYVASTGACWDPLPIERWDGAMPAPEGAVLTIDRDGVINELVYPDRIMARDPSSPSAHLALAVGMLHLKRTYPGCEGAEPENPVVPDDQREIRIEYVPPGGRATPASTARSRRTGVG